MVASRTTVPLFLALMAAPGLFAGHPVGHAPYLVFKSMDADNDGRLTHAEHIVGSRQLFAAMDADHDGQVTLAELTATYALDENPPPAGLAADILEREDANHDGKLSAAEHAAADEAMFVRLDTNHDGWLSETECEAGVKAMRRDESSVANSR